MEIRIVYYSEVIDNWGRTESSTNGETIHRVLTTPDEWTDDMTFEDDKGNVYFIDDLIGKEILLPDISSLNGSVMTTMRLRFTVPEE